MQELLRSETHSLLMWDLRFSRRWSFKLTSFGFWRRVVLW